MTLPDETVEAMARAYYIASYPEMVEREATWDWDSTKDHKDEIAAMRAALSILPEPPVSAAPEETYPDPASISKAAHSIAALVDEYTNRGWNAAGRANFAAIIKHRLKRFAPKVEVTTT